MVGNVDIPKPVESPTVFPVTVNEIGSSLVMLPVSVNNLPQEKLPLSPDVEYDVDNPETFVFECTFTSICLLYTSDAADEL